MTNPVTIVANRPNVPPETSCPADLYQALVVIALACRAAPATIRRLLELARSANLRVARAACGDLLQVRSLPDDMRWEVLRLLAIHELKARAARRRPRSAGRRARR